ncbi:MAG: FKBP-type peptidyl-prolyl cis-trans isomerase [Bacteroidia bacterium]|nr:FKBP-type peptidyl-prolyl cis-trans isomerase [Bacteroidia bacterium]MDW8158699.1 FKBP-type peptidyl-prolyl cis-trans isomerase [Bacteroidia bacterium]
MLIYLLILLIISGIVSCSEKKTEEAANDKPPYVYDSTQAISLPSGLKYVIVKEGTGRKPVAGDVIIAHYHGLLANDTVFDSSFNRGEPFKFKLGAGQVIRGWEEGFAQLKEGTKAVLIVPPNLGYGDRAQGKIPPNSTLYFHVELLQVKEGYVPYAYDSTKLKKTPSGLEYHIIEEGNGAPIQKGMRVKLHYHASAGKQELGSTFDSEPQTVLLGSGQIFAGWEEALMMLKEGGKGVFVIPKNLGPQGANFPGKLVMRLHVLKAEKFEPFKPYAYDKSKAQKTASGLQYVIIEEGRGPQPKVGEEVFVHYHGMLEDGKVFDSSFNRGEPFKLKLGAGQVIKGWEEGIALLKKGSKAVLIIPAELGYGAQGMPPAIPPNATLIFHVHLQE